MPIDVPDHQRHMLERKGLVELGPLPARRACRMLTDRLTTFPDARRLFDAVAEVLGDRAVLEEEHGPTRALFVRDADDATFVCVPPIVREDGQGPTYAQGEPRRDRILPAGPDMHDGRVTLTAGGVEQKIEYGSDGGIASVSCGGDFFSFIHEGDVRPFVVDPSARPPTAGPLPVLLRPELVDGPPDIDWLARALVQAFDDAPPPVRVAMPVMLPFGAAGCLRRCAHPHAYLFWTQPIRIPEDGEDGPRFFASDGFVAMATAFGPTRAAALDALKTELWRVRPPLPDDGPDVVAPGPMPGGRPLPPAEGATPIPLPVAPRPDDSTTQVGLFHGTFSFTATTIHAWPKATPEHTPVVLIPIPPRPAVPPPLRDAGFALRLLASETGRPQWAWIREDARGWTLVGSGVADLVDPDTLDDELDAADRAYAREMGTAWNDPEYALRTLGYELWDNGHQHRIPARVTSAELGGFSLTSIDADRVTHRVVRLRPRA